MTEAEWLACTRAWDMFGRFDFEASPRKLRLFVVACCRCSRPLLSDANLRRAVDLAERFADGLATEKELGAAFERTRERVSELDAGKTEREIRRWAEAGAVLYATAPPDRGRDAAAETGWHVARAAARRDVEPRMASLLRDIVGNPFRPPKFSPEWRTPTAVAIAQQMYDSRDFSAMPILADALQDAGCENADVLDHCRDAGQVHVRGCWVVDLVLGKA